MLALVNAKHWIVQVNHHDEVAVAVQLHRPNCLRVPQWLYIVDSFSTQLCSIYTEASNFSLKKLCTAHRLSRSIRSIAFGSEWQCKSRKPTSQR